MIPTGSLFTGGALFDLGAKAAGFEPAWGIELEPQIAEVASHNLRHRVRVADVLTVNPRRLEPVDALHASPPCPNYSAAKVGSKETALDIALARKIAEFVAVLSPRVFTLENVPAYARGKGWALLEHALWREGYWLHVAILNAADFGVPQTRRRMVVRAVRGDLVPALPPKRAWRGWLGAIADLIPDLPESQFAPWQLERLPEKLATMLVHPTNQRTMPVRDEDEPSFTCVAGIGYSLNMPRAYLVDSANANGSTDEPTVRDSDAPSFTITATGNRVNHRALFEGGRVVKMTPRALARFQGIPDTYELPEAKSLACRIIGNACPPPLFEQLYQSLSPFVEA